MKIAQNPGPSVGGEGKVRGHETPFRRSSCADGQQVEDGGDVREVFRPILFLSL